MHSIFCIIVCHIQSQYKSILNTRTQTDSPLNHAITECAASARSWSVKSNHELTFSPHKTSLECASYPRKDGA